MCPEGNSQGAWDVLNSRATSMDQNKLRGSGFGQEMGEIVKMIPKTLSGIVHTLQH
jgi:hypothetical protein